MSTFGAIHKGALGLQAFGKALGEVSSNVSNMNTPGYKGKTTLFRELGAGVSDRAGALGRDDALGVRLDGVRVRFESGELRETGNPDDLAIDGDGFFVLRDGEDLKLTRAGQFSVDEEGYLVDADSKYRLAGAAGAGALVDINLNTHRISAPSATTRVNIGGTINASATPGTEVTTLQGGSVAELELYADDGALIKARLKLVKLDGSNWRAYVVDERGSALMTSHVLAFGSSGTPTTTSSVMTLGLETFVYVENPDKTERLSIRAPVTFSSALPSSGSSADISARDAQMVVRSGEEVSFTESGVFHLDNDGFLLDMAGRRLAAESSSGALTDVNVSTFMNYVHKATTTARFFGALPAAAAIGDTYPPLSDQPVQFQVVDNSGARRDLNIRLEKLATREWGVIVRDSAGNQTRPAQRLVFSPGSTGANPLASGSGVVPVFFDFGGGVSFSFSLNFSGGDVITPIVESNDQQGETSLVLGSVDGEVGGRATEMTLGAEGILQFTYANGVEQAGPRLALVKRSHAAVSGVRLDFSGLSAAASPATSGLSITRTDGRASGYVVKHSYERDGDVVLSYSNGDSKQVATLSLALVHDLAVLESTGGASFRVPAGVKLVYGRPGGGVFGSLVEKSLEASNVELTQELSELMLLQRGYQASSQVLNASSQMIEELYNSVKTR